MLAPVLCTLAVLAQAAEQPDRGAFQAPQIHFEREAGEEWWTISARNAPPLRVVERIAELSGRSIENPELLERAGFVAVQLERRPLSQALEYMLGSIALRHQLRRDAIVILPLDDATKVEDALQRSAAGWLKATTLFPNDPDAPMARISQGEVAELRGLGQVARNHYLSMVDDYPDAEEAPEALMRAGRLSTRMGLFAEAAELFRELSIAENREYRAAARLELARAKIQLGDPDYALHIVRTLDENYPPLDKTEHTARALVRAKAQNHRGEHVEALRELDGLDERFDALGAWEALSIRAEALSGVGLHGEAARAWLAYSGDARDEEKENALLQAARLSLEAGDEIGTLFVCKEAKQRGFTEGFGTFQREARRRLGFAIAGTAEGEGVVDQLEQGEELVAEGRIGEAAPIFERLYLGRLALDDEMTARVTSGWATCVNERHGLEPAITILSEQRSLFTSLPAKQHLDRTAAGLLEQANLYERAVQAYQGSY